MSLLLLAEFSHRPVNHKYPALKRGGKKSLLALVHVVLKAPCKNDAGFTGSLVACSGLASAARQGTRSSVCVWLAGMGVGRCRTGARSCSDFSANGQLANVRQKRKIFSFSVGSAVVSEETFIYSDFGTSSEKDGAPARDEPEGESWSAHCTRNVAIVVEIVLRKSTPKRYSIFNENLWKLKLSSSVLIIYLYSYILKLV